MPTTSLLAHPDLKTQRHLCLQCSVCIIKKTKTLWDTVSIENVGVVFKFALIWYVCYYANAKKNRIEIWNWYQCAHWLGCTLASSNSCSIRFELANNGSRFSINWLRRRNIIVKKREQICGVSWSGYLSNLFCWFQNCQNVFLCEYFR